MNLRESLDALLALKPGVMISRFDPQSQEVLMLPGAITEHPFTTVGPWVCVDFEDGEHFAIFKNTGAVYRCSGPFDEVADDPIPGMEFGFARSE